MKKNKFLSVCMVFIMLVACFVFNPVTGGPGIAAVDSIVYVDVNATGFNNGTSWDDAFTDLQLALEAAVSGDQIWVAAGMYYPTVEHCGLNDVRYQSFQLKNGVAVYGGFDPSAGGITWADRDWVRNPTILSGDIGVKGDVNDNSFHVFCHPTQSALDRSTVLDGFTITGGNAAGGDAFYHNGGGMSNENSSPTLTNLVFYSNISNSRGGAIYNSASSPTLTNVLFYGNDGGVGGGISNVSSNPILINVTFWGNNAHGSGSGAIRNEDSIPILVNCILWGNTPDQMDGNYATVSYSDIEGGYNGEGNIGSDPLFADPAAGDLRLQSTSPAIDAGDNSAVPPNLTTDLDGYRRFVDIPSIADSGKGTPPIVDMGAYEVHRTYYVDVDAAGSNDGNTWADAFNALQPGLAAALPGDQIWVAVGTYYPTVEHCGSGARFQTFQLVNEVAVYGGFNPSAGDVSMTDRDWVANHTILSGDIGIPGDHSDNSYHVFCHPQDLELDSSAILDGFTITGGNANNEDIAINGGGMVNEFASPTLSNILFSENAAGFGGGMSNSDSSPILTNIMFSSNLAMLISTGGKGGGLYNASSSPVLVDATFSGNTANTFGGGIYNLSSSPLLTNVSFSGNAAFTSGGGMYNLNFSSPTVTNSILWWDIPDEIADDSGSSVVSYSDIQGGYPGEGNIDSDPLFVEPAVGDLHLQGTSPAIDAGNNAALPSNITTDLDGRGRFADIPWIMDTGNGMPPIVDMGAYEVHRIFHVDADATGANNGSSWADAYTDLQPALEVALSEDQVWVAAGTYYPSVEHCGSGSRFQSFQLVNGVALYGGFDPSVGDVGWADRNWISNATILSGDIGVSDDSSDNSYHVFCHEPDTILDNSTIMDGFTITAGRADGIFSSDKGGGMLNNRSSPSLANITFTENYAVIGGGLAIFGGSSTTLINVTFLNNMGDSGAGMYSQFSSSVLVDVTFSGNSAGGAGGMYNDEAFATLTNVIFKNNTVTVFGGAMINYMSSPVLTNVTFSGNVANAGGGAIWNQNSGPTLINATFTNNTSNAYGRGGAIFNSTSSITLTNCIVWGDSQPEISSEDYGTTIITYSDVEGGFIGEGNFDADPLLAPVGKYGGNLETMALLPGSPAIDVSSTNCPSTDARGVTRPPAHCDLGAFESQGFSLAITSGNNQSTLTHYEFPDPLCVQVTSHDALEPIEGGQLTYIPPSVGPSAEFSENPVVISGDVVCSIAKANYHIGGPYPVIAAAAGAEPVMFSLTNLVLPGQVYLPSVHKPYPGIWGNVTMNGQPASGVNLYLRFWDGGSWSTRATTTTDASGYYLFRNVPSLLPGQVYYVRYVNETQNPDRISGWWTRQIHNYSSGGPGYAGDFDLANIYLGGPYSGATVTLPVTFSWYKRLATPTDSYELNLFNPYDQNQFFYTDLLGYIDNYYMTDLPAGFKYGAVYGWYIAVYSPDGGYGESYYYYEVTFSGGILKLTPTAVDEAPQPLARTDMERPLKP